MLQLGALSTGTSSDTSGPSLGHFWRSCSTRCSPCVTTDLKFSPSKTEIKLIILHSSINHCSSFELGHLGQMWSRCNNAPDIEPALGGPVAEAISQTGLEWVEAICVSNIHSCVRAGNPVCARYFHRLLKGPKECTAGTEKVRGQVFGACSVCVKSSPKMLIGFHITQPLRRTAALKRSPL